MMAASTTTMHPSAVGANNGRVMGSDKRISTTDDAPREQDEDESEDEDVEIVDKHVRHMETLLRCNICQGPFRNAMILPCSHNFCSECIRMQFQAGAKALTYRSQCPTCHHSSRDSDLRSNRALDELVALFAAARSKLARVGVEASPKSSTNRISTGKGVSEDDDDSAMQPSGFSQTCRVDAPGEVVSSQAQQKSPHAILVASQQNSHEGAGPAEVRAVDAGQSQTTSPASLAGDGQVAECPVCGRRMLISKIDKHLDICLNSGHRKDSLRALDPPQQQQVPSPRTVPAEKQQNPQSTFVLAPEKMVVKRKPLPKPHYKSLSAKELKRLVAECHLPAQGVAKDVMIRLHQKLVLLYNAESDGVTPMSLKDCAAEILRREQLAQRKEVDGILNWNKSTPYSEVRMRSDKYLKKKRELYRTMVAEAKVSHEARKKKKIDANTLANQSGSGSTDNSLSASHSVDAPQNGGGWLSPIDEDSDVGSPLLALESQGSNTVDMDEIRASQTKKLSLSRKRKRTQFSDPDPKDDDVLSQDLI